MRIPHPIPDSLGNRTKSAVIIPFFQTKELFSPFIIIGFALPTYAQM